MSQENVEIVPKSFAVHERSSRTLDQRLGLRFPGLAHVCARLLGRLPPGSRVRRTGLRRAVRLAAEAFNRRDVDAAVNPGSPDFEYIPPREFVEAGFFEPCYRGPAGFRKYMSAWSEVFGADLRVEPVELIDLGDRIVLLAEFPARTPRPSKPWGCENRAVASRSWSAAS